MNGGIAGIAFYHALVFCELADRGLCCAVLFSIAGGIGSRSSTELPAAEDLRVFREDILPVVYDALCYYVDMGQLL